MRNDDFKELVDRYYKNKSIADDYAKLAKPDNEAIKKEMVRRKINNWDKDELAVTYRVDVSKTLNEKRVLDALKEDWVAKHGKAKCPWIKKVEVVDMEELEKAMYDNQVDAKLVESCKEEKQTPKLFVKLKKS